jgi:hypothetical protein
MTLDFVLAHPTAQFLATETEKVALLRARLIPSVVWPHRNYPPRRATGQVTTRYFVDKMPWYQQGDDARVWIAYVDTERTLQGFQTFLDQYRALLASLPSGVTYVAPTAWHGVIHAAFTKALESRDAHIMSRFREYCELRRTIDAAHSNWPLTPDQRRRFREQSADFLTPAFDELYKTFVETSSMSSTDIAAAAFPPCLLRVHALGRRYDPSRSHESPSAPTEEVT